MILKESVLQAAKLFLTEDQTSKNQLIDNLFEEQPSMVVFLEYLDKTVASEASKEVILQLTMIFYLAVSLQKIKIKKIPFNDFTDSLRKNSDIKNYFHNPHQRVDGKTFKTFVEAYPQKEILNYTHFAINHQFNPYVNNEQDALFIFYIMTVVGDVIHKNIKH